MRIFLLAGTRPNYMKVFPLWKAIRSMYPEWTVRIVHTGQHYDARMSDVFFSDFGMPEPDHFLGVGSGSHAAQTARVMIALEALMEKERPDLLVVVGDVNSTMAGALVAVKMGIPVAHVEAGLRSGDRSMPEEINRVVTDSISDLLLTTGPDADRNLLREGVGQARIHCVGNIMIDSLVQMLPRARDSRILADLGLKPFEYALVTLHRPSNVDQPGALARRVGELTALSSQLPVVFPVHPRTRKMIEQTGVALPSGMSVLEPVGYVDFLGLESQAGLVVTDSGGIQPEATYLGIPCLTIRHNTEWSVTIEKGSNRLVNPLSGDLVAEALDALLRRDEYRRRAQTGIDGWDGQTAPRMVDIIARDPR